MTSYCKYLLFLPGVQNLTQLQVTGLQITWLKQNRNLLIPTQKPRVMRAVLRPSGILVTPAFSSVTPGEWLSCHWSRTAARTSAILLHSVPLNGAGMDREKVENNFTFKENL